MVAQEIGLTMDEALAASMRELGLSLLLASDTKLAIFDSYVQMIRDTKRIPTQLAVARQLGIQQSVVSRFCNDMEREGIMGRVDAAGRKPGFCPILSQRFRLAPEAKAA